MNLIGEHLKKNQIYNLLELYRDLYGDSIHTRINKDNNCQFDFINHEVSNKIFLGEKTNYFENYFGLIPLSSRKKNIFFGLGLTDSKIIFISKSIFISQKNIEFEFTGENGKLFDKMLSAIGLKRKDIFMYSLLNSYDKNVNKTSNKEVFDFTKNIRNIISSDEKKIIVFMGRTNFLDKNIFSANNYEIIESFAPSELIAEPKLKKRAWNDFKLIREKYLNA
ncbi:MAG: hypothetical protein CMG61_02215 [Candidatus Marinimicrobia bacterium]|nr:hypothetical protein [Candidatus Neomarinimicrobiota bacterium]|tara:strand:- start:6469 stop:7134 length:666 start_codon:yes stop_codon:yes gene_type:complete